MTAPGLKRLEEELRTLKSAERPAVIRAIAEARSHGDLSENAEYHAARDRQSFIEGRIAELEEIVSAVQVIDPEFNRTWRIRCSPRDILKFFIQLIRTRFEKRRC